MTIFSVQLACVCRKLLQTRETSRPSVISSFPKFIHLKTMLFSLFHAFMSRHYKTPLDGFFFMATSRPQHYVPLLYQNSTISSKSFLCARFITMTDFQVWIYYQNDAPEYRNLALMMMQGDFRTSSATARHKLYDPRLCSVGHAGHFAVRSNGKTHQISSSPQDTCQDHRQSFEEHPRFEVYVSHQV